MRAVVQRVTSAKVSAGGVTVSEIGPGMLILLGIGLDDTEPDAARLAAKIRKLRIFNGPDGRMGMPLGDREILCVSQFTLYADTRRGNRPGFSAAATGEAARPLYERFCELLEAKRGAFGEAMAVESINDGPVTLLIDEPAELY